MNKVLIVEDSMEIQELLTDFLQNNHYATMSAYSGTEALLLANMHSFDLILLDLMLPGKSGGQVLTELQHTLNSQTPVLILSAKNSMEEKIQLLRSGADDYLDKPFNLDELLARMELCLKHRSIQSKEVKEESYHIGELRYHPASHRICFKQEEINLTPQEFKILSILIKHPQKIFTKQELFQLAWETDYLGEDKTINVHIGNIRKKLLAISQEEWIETVWGIGFRIHPKHL
ncbi:response regulator transcription factor [Facklamia lactis]|uniref:response regulator transcription factor n=1 Tax=Facklamia lactis TaxID=2749967 RepID=UPI0018CDA017|nr:response regulator transcription factor [Facklamia lactis]MBG9979732.1 response regulator transcription factor [Facklamia lactis]